MIDTKKLLGHTAALFVMAGAPSACGGQTESVPVPAAPATAASVRPETWISGVRIHKRGERSTVELEETFASGEQLEVTMRVGSLPVHSTVRIRWLRHSDGKLLEDAAQQGRSGQHSMSFEVPRSISSEPGRYRAEVWVGGREVHQQPFTIVESDWASNAS